MKHAEVLYLRIINHVFYFATVVPLFSDKTFMPRRDQQRAIYLELMISILLVVFN